MPQALRAPEHTRAQPAGVANHTKRARPQHQDGPHHAPNTTGPFRCLEPDKAQGRGAQERVRACAVRLNGLRDAGVRSWRQTHGSVDNRTTEERRRRDTRAERRRRRKNGVEGPAVAMGRVE